MVRLIVIGVILVLASFLFGPEANAGCCITPPPSSCVTMPQLGCEDIVGADYDSRECSRVELCTVSGKCENSSLRLCEDTVKYVCDAKGPSYVFFVGQSCSQPALPGTCCILYNLGSSRFECRSDISSSNACRNLQQPNITATWDANRPCTSVPNCPQSAAIGQYKSEDQKKTETIFKPSITIPGSKFIAGQEIKVSGKTLGEYVAAFYVFFVGIIGILAVTMILWGAIQWITAAGNAGKISAAKEQISSALIGLLLALAAYTILNLISPRLVQITDLTSILKPVTRITQEIEGSEKSRKGPTAVAWSGQNVSKYDQELTDAAARHSLDRDWLKAIMLIESSGDPNAVSPAGACGLLQVLPETAGLSCDQLKNATTGIEAGAKYLSSLLATTCPQTAKTISGTEVTCQPELTKCTNGSYHYAVAAYNGGLGANCSSVTCSAQTWWECFANPGFAETRDYVEKVEQAHAKIVAESWWSP